MKRVAIILLLLLLPLASALSIEMNSEYAQGETLIAKVPGVLLEPIAKNDISFYRGHIQIPIDYNVIKSNDDFYIYAQLIGKQEGNYSILIKDVIYNKIGQKTEEDLSSNFTIKNSSADFAINPGAVFTKDNFEITLSSLSENTQTITIATTNLGLEHLTSVTLKSGEEKEIEFDIDDIYEPTAGTITFSSSSTTYEMPFYIFTNGSERSWQIDLDPSSFEIMTTTNSSNTSRFLRVKNIGTEDLENISLSISKSLKDYIEPSLSQIDNLDEGENQTILLRIFSTTKEETIQGQITISAKNISNKYLAITLNVSAGYKPLANETIDFSSYKYCNELGGVTCEDNQECSVTEVSSLDGNCCIGTCQTTSSSESGKLVGWLIIIGTIIFAGWFLLIKNDGLSRIREMFGRE